MLINIWDTIRKTFPSNDCICHVMTSSFVRHCIDLADVYFFLPFWFERIWATPPFNNAIFEEHWNTMQEAFKCPSRVILRALIVDHIVPTSMICRPSRVGRLSPPLRTLVNQLGFYQQWWQHGNSPNASSIYRIFESNSIPWCHLIRLHIVNKW